MKKSEFEKLVSGLSNAELVVFFTVYIAEMKRRGLERDIYSVVANVTVARRTDEFVDEVKKAMDQILYKSRLCGVFLNVFRGKERERVSYQVFVELLSHRSDPSRAVASLRCRVNNLLGEMGFDLYVFTETKDRGLNHTYQTEYWLGRRPR